MAASNRKISDEQQKIYATIEKNGAQRYMGYYKDYLEKLVSKNGLKLVDIGGGRGIFRPRSKDVL